MASRYQRVQAPAWSPATSRTARCSSGNDWERLGYVGWQQPERAMWGEWADGAKVPVVQGGDDIGAEIPGEHDVHRVDQSNGRVVLQNRMSGEQERTDRGHLPAACRYPAGGIPDDGACGRRPLAGGDEVVEFGENAG